jgi:PAS domain S-box-containing protein
MIHRSERLAWAYNLCAGILLVFAFSPVGRGTQSRTVHVGVYQNEPKIFIDEDGQAAGIFMDILDEIAIQEGWKLVYVPCEWADCLRALENGQIDLMPDVAYSQDREAMYDFHEIPVLQSWSEVYAAPGSSINKITQLGGKRVAVLKGSIQQTGFEQTMNGFGYTVTIIPADSLRQAFNSVADGSADAAIANHFFGDYFYQEYGLVKTTVVFSPASLYYATAEGRNPDLLAAIDRRLGQWIQISNSPYYMALSHWSTQEPAYRAPRYLLWIIGGITGLLIIATGIVLLLRQQIKVRTRTLEQASEELLKSEQRYQTLARISPVGIFRTEPNGSTTYVNPKWCEISGLSVDQAMGDRWLDAVHADDQEKLSRGWQESTQLEKPSYSEYRFLHPDGTITWVMGQAVPEMNSRDQVIGYVGTVTDITERVQIEMELRSLNTELEERVILRTKELSSAMRQAQEADRLKSAFLATMSHELRTPLNSIIGFTGVLLQGLAGPLNTEQMKQQLMVRDSAYHLLALINDVLDISKIEAGQLEVARSSFDMRAAIEDTMRSVLPQAQKKGLTLTAAIASNVGVLFSDRRRVEQILLNLLSNAIKFTDRGEVQLACLVEGEWLEISVHDTGIGIRPEDLDKLFEPFHQLEVGLNRRHEGTGLGLAICKNLVMLLGGQIRVESEPGAGSTFTFTLPLAPQGGPHGEHFDHRG